MKARIDAGGERFLPRPRLADGLHARRSMGVCECAGANYRISFCIVQLPVIAPTILILTPVLMPS